MSSLWQESFILKRDLYVPMGKSLRIRGCLDWLFKVTCKLIAKSHNLGPFGVAQWFGLGTSMLEVSSLKPLDSESKGFAFWVELVALGLTSAGYLTYVVCELLHRSGGFYPVVCTQRVAAAGFPCH
ncbi:hypothetical protein H5410_030701 [Solanum commersonii]|uniref:Uncharacterized protein n=1 Tax=Solanum commersonii TaxID=4109 RepID=A0A9J5YF18_SOLCO|nr:hypothetical protein H5410_030701 [Solanum commersonii]